MLGLKNRIAEYPRSVKSWKGKTDWFTFFFFFEHRTSRARVENFPGHTTLLLLQEMQTAMEENRI